MCFSSFAVTIVHIEFEFMEFIEQGQSFKNVQVSQKLRLHFYFHKILCIFFDFYNVKERAQPQYGRLMHTALSVYTARPPTFVQTIWEGEEICLEMMVADRWRSLSGLCQRWTVKRLC